LLLIVGDGIRENVQNLLESLHSHPQLLFTFALVEVQIYDNPTAAGSRIIIPQVIANTVEIVRAVVKVHTTGQATVSVEMEHEQEPKAKQGGQPTLSEEEFFNEITDVETKDVCKRLLQFADEIGAVRGWRASSVSIQLPDPRGSKQNVTLFVIYTAGSWQIGWTIQQHEALGLPTRLGMDYAKSVAALFPGVTPQKKHPDTLSRFLEAADIGRRFGEFTSVVREFVHKVVAASKN
jgi:hypothetical protein